MPSPATSERYNPRSRGQDKPCDFCVRSGTFSRLGVQDTQKCPLENRNVAALMLTMPGRVAGDHPFLPRFAAILLQVVSPPVKVGWDTALSAGKIPHVHLVPLNVSWRVRASPDANDRPVLNTRRWPGASGLLAVRIPCPIRLPWVSSTWQGSANAYSPWR